MRKLLVLFLLMVLLVACNSDGECREERYVAMGMKLMYPKFDVEKETYVATEFVPDSITVKGVDNDSVLYYKKQMNELQLPLQKSNDSSQFVLYTNGIYDTITILHENRDNFISMECGCIVFATIKEVLMTHYRLDSARILIPDVINVEAMNVELYYKTVD